ncbi:hypothetical protein BST83_00870 [Polaribacter filamentus]|uniref:Sulfatase N-terminal domain-containing protein n=1 Tax=Polaribacter filamentus TaxID=53483 RepID=A0A2S7L228_9FLAO|nr:sulfatase/phosphatase domain-containing protein [Polaribacter filamentus]PQB08940.1 hypothetical protein BST83_00870 [Polaribacter filamentus]
MVEKYKKKGETWPDKSKKWNPTYVAMIEVMDNSVGVLRAKLKELNLDENTVFMVVSDNGNVGNVTTNSPLRGAKGAMYEGGIRTFGTAVWPGKIAAGSTTDYPITGVDLLPTFAEIAGAELPKDQTFDGQSFVELLKTGKNIKERAIFWHYLMYLKGGRSNKGWEGDNVLPIYRTDRMYWRAAPSSTIMQGDWKLIYFYEYEKYELYNVATDISEEHDLSKSIPEISKKLYDKLMTWVKETEADAPTKVNPDFVKKLHSLLYETFMIKVSIHNEMTMWISHK